MTERWERELTKLRQIDMHEPTVRQRIERGPTGDHHPRRRDRAVAGVVGTAVAIAAVAFLWQAVPRDEHEIGGRADQLPVLRVTFEGDGMIGDAPDEEIRRVDTTIAYGDTREEGFTSTIPSNAHVDWIPVDMVTRFTTALVAGSRVEIEADGDDPRVLIGDPSDWPAFERFAPIDALPEVPGDYVLVFEADYREGVAQTARYVQIVAAPEERPTPVTETPQLSPGPVPPVPGSVVVTVFGLGERSDEMPTAVFSFANHTKDACTQDFEWTLGDGARVEDTVPDCVDLAGSEVPPGTAITIESATATDVDTTRTTTPFFEGDAGLVVSATWPEGRASFIVPLAVVDGSASGHITLDCEPGERVAFSPPSGARIMPGGSAYITGNLPGIHTDDVVEQMTREGDGGAGGWNGAWQVVRDGSVIAAVDVGSLNGVACSGSGVGGV